MPGAPLVEEQPTGRKPWWELPSSGDEGGESGTPAEAPFPGQGWPALDSINYVTKLIVLVILLLALPWLLSKLLTAPHEVTGHAAGLSMGAASMGV